MNQAPGSNSPLGGPGAPGTASEGSSTEFLNLNSGFGSTQMGSSSRPTVFQLVFRDKASLFAAYMPFLNNGGLFVPSSRDYKLGDDVYLLVTLMDDPQKYPVVGKVAWITPPRSSGGRTQGVGVKLPADEKTMGLRVRIEEILGTAISAARPTQTI